MKHTISAMAVGLTASVNREFHIAPMQCYTNQPLRKLYSFLSPTAIKWTEMEKVDDLLPNIDQALAKRLGGEEHEKNLVLQLGTNDATKLHDCVRIASELYPNLKEINLNCGCPAIDTGGATTYGASIMKDTSLTAQLVDSMVTASDLEISVKCRIGVFDKAEDVVPMGEKQFRYLHNYISTLHDSGANHVILHARPAILSLSPVKNRNIPQLNYEVVQKIADQFNGKIKVTLNGGINSLDDLKTIQRDNVTAVTGFMSGRWFLRRPLDLISVEHTLASSIVPGVQSAIEKYVNYANAMSNQNRFTMGELCLPLYLVASQLQEDYDQEEDNGILSWEEIEQLYNLLEEGLNSLCGGNRKLSNSLSFKRLASSFGPLVGKKVVNKWKRNRAEL
eukprot:scaffold229302_cov61-Cyclotella_meneghiniana.AAC.10